MSLIDYFIKIEILKFIGVKQESGFNHASMELAGLITSHSNL